MLDKITILKILLLVSFTLTVGVVLFFITYANQNNNSTSEIVYTQSSSISKSSLSKTLSSSSTVISSSSLISSSSNNLSSSSLESSSISSLLFPVLDNNLDIVKDISLIVEKPNPEIQELIKSAKNRPKKEIRTSIIESTSSAQESIKSITEKP